MTEEPQHLFEYSKDQWSVIRTSLGAFNLSEEEMNALRLRLLLRMVPEISIGEAQYQRQPISARDAIRRLYEAIGDRIGSEGQIEGEAIPDGVGLTLERASPHLEELSRLLQREIDVSEKLDAWSKELPRKSNNERSLARRLMREVADSWSRVGGRIGLGKSYRAFFEAVMRPVLEDKRLSHGSAWSDGMFRNHVQQSMKARGLSGKRGPQSKTQRRQTGSATQN
jgi:hypothetical protein